MCLSLLAPLAPAVPVRGQCSPEEQPKITALDAGPSNFFGRSMAVSGDTMVVGANNAEAAYVFVRTGGWWTQQAKLTPSDLGGFFGWSVAIAGETVVVGAYLNTHDNLASAGAAYVFVRSGTVWTEQAKLTPSDPAQDDNFGIAVAISGDTIVVGAEFAEYDESSTDEGAAYVFVRTGSVWTQQARLDGSDVFGGPQFGNAVAVSGDTAIIGTRSGIGSAGAAYVYVRAGTVWTPQATLSAIDGSAGDQFGYAIAIAGDTAVIGAPFDDIPGFSTDSGSAYVFSRSGNIWGQSAKLVAEFPASLEVFGISVALEGNTVLVGTSGDGLPGIAGAGSAFLFVRSGYVWVRQARLMASDAAANDRLGDSVALAGDTALAGAPQDDHAAGTDAGSVYVYSTNCDDDGDGVPNAGDICSGTPAGQPVDHSGRPLRDCNGDCVVDGGDLQCIVAELLGP